MTRANSKIKAPHGAIRTRPRPLAATPTRVSRGRLPAEQADELARRENVALDAVRECRLRDPSGKPKHSVQREDREVVMVCGARRRARSAVAIIVEVVTALARAI